MGLARLGRGIEKESLRVLPDGRLSPARHPSALGAPLTHPTITTDFSEAQLELITGVHRSVDDCLQQLQTIHKFVYQNIGDELLWPASMPCMVGDADQVPIGQYGSANIAMAKTIYRRGLGVRYGRLMQTISGIHYNFSVSDELWQTLGIQNQDDRTAAYFGLIRNFRRWSWLLLYLFGASPAVCKSFTRSISHELQEFDEGSLHLPHATSLRMGPLGYQSDAQAQLRISYNSLAAYTSSMLDALTTEYPPYAAAGIKRDGEYQQLNSNILQIENEFYGTIRPKRTIESGERPVNALLARGVEYVEVRCVDLNPYLPLGLDANQVRFMDTFLLLCLLAESPPDDEAEIARMAANQLAVVERGRDPELRLANDRNKSVAIEQWATEILAACAELAALQDTADGSTAYTQALAAQQAKVQDPSLTPSAQVLTDMQAQQIPFFRLTMQQAEKFRTAALAEPLEADVQMEYEEVSAHSLREKDALESAESVTFDDFLEQYLALN